MRKLVPYTSWLNILGPSSTYKSVILLTRKKDIKIIYSFLISLTSSFKIGAGIH